jgi:hypothetical protein
MYIFVPIFYNRKTEIFQSKNCLIYVSSQKAISPLKKEVSPQNCSSAKQVMLSEKKSFFK